MLPRGGPTDAKLGWSLLPLSQGEPSSQSPFPPTSLPQFPQKPRVKMGPTQLSLRAPPKR